jgi:hypothetical protein
MALKPIPHPPNQHPIILHNKWTPTPKECPQSPHHATVFILDHLPTKLWTLITFAYGVHKRRTLVRWNPMPIAHETQSKPTQPTNGRHICSTTLHSLSTVYITKAWSKMIWGQSSHGASGALEQILREPSVCGFCPHTQAHSWNHLHFPFLFCFTATV